MTLLIIGLLAWFALHLFPVVASDARAGLLAKMGIAYKGAFALATIGAVALMSMGYQQADYIDVWSPPAFLTHLNNLLMVLAVYLFIGGQFKNSAMQKVVRHPQLNGTKTWAIAHLLVNGDLASIILFGGLFAWAMAAMIATNKRDGKPPRDVEVTAIGSIIHVVAALVVTGLVIAAHWYLGGIWPLPG